MTMTTTTLVGGHGAGGSSFSVDDALDSDERDRLESALAEADAELDRGEGISGEQFLAELRARRHP